MLLRDIVFGEVATESEDEETGGGTMVTFSLKGALDRSSILYDGSTPATIPPTAFIETETDEIIAVDGTISPTVLGEAITQDSL
jgi:hypothetical protein